MKKILTGIKPTGNGMHIGNYFGAFKPFLDLAEGKKAYIFIADYHSLTSVHKKETLENNKRRMLCEYFALLPDNTEIVVFEQSKVRRINDITWILSSVTPYSLMLRAHAFKDAQSKNSEINMATFNYPILMTSDIITYDTDIVPVGKDQTQHVEFARDIVKYFNEEYKINLFKLPELYVEEKGAIIKGTDGRKMSKSYDNFIGIFDDEDIIKKRINSFITGSEGLEEPKDPEKCNIFSLIKLLAPKSKQDEIAKKYKEGGYGYGHAKDEFFEIFLEYFKEARAKYKNFENNMNIIEEKLKSGNKEANKLANKKYKKMMEAVGLSK